MIPNILSIAGSDPSGGAGIQADLKAISANGGYGMAAITALTAQNTMGVSDVQMVTPEFVIAQLEAVFTDIRVDAVKIGMLGTARTVAAVARVLEGRKCPVILDPVMVAKGGDRLLAREAVEVLRDHLLPVASIITPNLPEAAVLLDCGEAKNRTEMEDQARRLLELGSGAVLLKGGHLQGEESPDLLLLPNRIVWLEGKRFATKNCHGTGCTLSSALAAQLASSGELEAAVRAAKSYISNALLAADHLSVGHGHGPPDHFWMQRDRMFS